MVVYVGMMVWLAGLGGGDVSGFRQGVMQEGALMMEPDQLLFYGLIVLDVVYMKHQQIYLDLYTNLSGFTTLMDEHR